MPHGPVETPHVVVFSFATMASPLTGVCRAAAYLKLGNAEGALKDAEAATELDPDYAKAFLRRASAHQALEHFEDAVRDFEKVCAAAAYATRVAAAYCGPPETLIKQGQQLLQWTCLLYPGVSIPSSMAAMRSSHKSLFMDC